MCLFVSKTLQNQLSTGKWGVNGIKAAVDGTLHVSGRNSEMRTSLFLISSLDVIYTSIHLYIPFYTVSLAKAEANVFFFSAGI